MENQIILGDCRDVVSDIPVNSIQLIVTSPPYADQRSKTYGGIHPDRYVEWFLERSGNFLNVLKDDGTFILNIKEKASNGERHTYVIELVLALRKQGWLWTEEFIWSKKNCAPGKWPNRFRDAWEHCYQFNKQKKFKMNQEDVMVPIGSWAKSRIANLSETDHVRDHSRVNSGFAKRVANWKGRDKVYPTNVLQLSTECGNKNHSAAFPESLPAWFIRLFTDPGDIVLDPFVGSGTTAVASKKLQRNYIGIDCLEENVTVARQRLENVKNFEKA